ncbi:hypothetical protein RI129_011257 [Pyrocoelia pectoralis]|uniref:Peptidase S1 domain-containing protein n=1 Tax=Pyrocoelia pectoralis TaxID=417401 RepID=A0AAN7ZHB4_9COLE
MEKHVLQYTSLLSDAFTGRYSAAHIRDDDWRIVGGSNAPEGAYPYQISLRYLGSHNCGGSILDESTILTAAHCVIGFNAQYITIVVGSNRLSSGGEVHAVAETRYHPEYNSWLIKNDVALVKLKKPLAFGDRIQPIQIESDFVDGAVDCVLSGWGRLNYPGEIPDQLQHINLKTLTTKECVERLNDDSVDDLQVCTLTYRGEGACKGDSGGPLVVNKQIGIVSFGYPCAQGYPDVYTRVSAYKGWINENRY